MDREALGGILFRHREALPVLLSVPVIAASEANNAAPIAMLFMWLIMAEVFYKRQANPNRRGCDGLSGGSVGVRACSARTRAAG